VQKHWITNSLLSCQTWSTKKLSKKIAVANIVNDASCDFTTSGSVTLSEQVITPKELQVNLELCKQNFVNSWESLQLGYSAFDEIPKSFTDYLISYVGGVVAQATEQSIWNGDNSANGQFGGLYRLITGSAQFHLQYLVQSLQQTYWVHWMH